MKRNEIAMRIKTIGECETVEDMRNHLATFQNDLDVDYCEMEELQNTNQSLTENMEKLRKVNLDLFLKVGTKDKPDKEIEEPEDSKLTYENLFDENGGLK